MTTRILLPALSVTVATLLCWPSPVAGNDSWSQWRGADQDGVAPGSGYPVQWSEGKGVAWNTKIPGNGGSTPVVANGTAYLTSGIDGRNTLLAIDAEEGKIQWQVTLGEDRGGKHRKGSGSNPSAVTDGEHIIAYFRSGDIGCVDTSGKIQWQLNLQDRFGEDTLWWDLGTSPLLTDSAVIVAVMQTGPSYLVALDKETGEQLWKQDRMLGAPKESAQSYTTPLLVNADGQQAIAVMGADHLTLHDAETGEMIGKVGGFNPAQEQFFRSISSPVADGNIIVCPYARGATLTAVNLDQLAAGAGKDAVVWFRGDLGSDVPTPAAENGRVYVVGDQKRNKGRISCLDLHSGDTLWEVRLPKSRIGYSSSPLVAGNRLYVTGEDATTYVIGPLDQAQPKLIATNTLGDDAQYTVASPVPVGSDLLIRSRHRLYRISGK